MRTIALASVSALLLAAALAGPASAAKPTKEPQSLDPADFAAGEVCDFAVHIDYAGKPKSITFDRRDGALVEHASGHLVATITNVDSGASVTRNSSGPSKVHRDAAGHIVLRLGGASVFPLFDGDVTGRGLIVLKGGGAEFVLGDDEFTIVQATFPAHVEDLCATLG